MSLLQVKHMEPEENYGDIDGEYYDDDDEYLEEEYYEEEVVETEPPAAGGGMASLIAAAASKRTTRLESGGETRIRESRAEVQGQPKMDMAAQVAARAASRNARIESGGEVQIRVIPEAHKNEFVNIAEAAASVGRLTRLNEKTVEATAPKKEEEVWGGPSGLRTDHLRSTMFMAVNEAAAMGQMRGLKPVEVTNYDEQEQEEEEELEDIDRMLDEDGRRVLRTHHLMDRHLDEARKEKKDTWAPENSNAVRYNSIDDVRLPSEKAPQWKPKKPNRPMTERDLMDAIASAVAERAWERNYRLGRPKANLRVTGKCNCKYCVDPNPFQTHKYKKMKETGAEEALGPIAKSKPNPQNKKRAQPVRSTPPATKETSSQPKHEEQLVRSTQPTTKETPTQPKREASKGQPVKSEHSRKTKWTPPKRTPPPSAFRGAPEDRPKPKPKVPLDKLRPPPKPIRDEVEPVPEQVPVLSKHSGHSGPTILLDETKTWARPREKSKKDKSKKKKKDKKKKKSSSSSKKKDDSSGGCVIM